MTFDEIDAVLVARLAPRLRLLHEHNGDNWAATVRDLLAAIRETHALAHGGGGTEPGGAGTPDTPREDD